MSQLNTCNLLLHSLVTTCYHSGSRRCDGETRRPPFGDRRSAGPRFVKKENSRRDPLKTPDARTQITSPAVYRRVTKGAT